MHRDDGMEESNASYILPKGGWSFHRQRRLLALLLRQSLGRRRADEASHALMVRFGSLPAVVAAPTLRLQEVPGVGRSTAILLATVHLSSMGIARERIAPNRPILSSWSQLLDYCHAAMAYETKEQFRILFLDKKLRLIGDEVQQVGTVDHTPVYPREVIRRTLELSATGLILVHNHPSGDPAPSAADVRMTREIAEIAKPLGILLHDHIVIGAWGHSSLRSLHLL